ncbi:hypothetical protein PAAG_11950 [Paracoccidioides lutzii Pb01]|uniref:Uncharacterized protein n=1 Tax=Paracoccidioides lutzii (strain ATCC MYA-826 / Pb01) TaxID=502779 RepID=A0A0A2V0N5_PARBA|nr:hypothetical protein PAAG_11950 [Paracoccidioides lutzii Pb01]KGQ01371.1 hypothetical protein PAAG_11950 [Paracoccidioides lutzii Pb01]
MKTGETCYCDLCVETAATLCKPWVRLDGGAYTENQIKQREQYKTSSRSSPSKTRDTRIYFLEFCKASLIRDKKISENITTPNLVAFCRQEDHLMPLAYRYLRSVAKAIEWYNTPEEGEGTSQHWHLFVAHAQNLWLVLEKEMQSLPRAACSEIEYNQKVLGIANEFHFRDEHLAETHPDGYETHGHEMLKPSEVVSGLGLRDLRQDTPKEDQLGGPKAQHPEQG